MQDIVVTSETSKARTIPERGKTILTNDQKKAKRKGIQDRKNERKRMKQEKSAALDIVIDVNESGTSAANESLEKDNALKKLIEIAIAYELQWNHEQHGHIDASTTKLLTMLR